MVATRWRRARWRREVAPREVAPATWRGRSGAARGGAARGHAWGRPAAAMHRAGNGGHVRATNRISDRAHPTG